MPLLSRCRQCLGQHERITIFSVGKQVILYVVVISVLSLLLRLAVAVHCYSCLCVIVGEENSLKIPHMSTAGDDTGVSLFSTPLETGKAV